MPKVLQPNVRFLRFLEVTSRNPDQTSGGWGVGQYAPGVRPAYWDRPGHSQTQASILETGQYAPGVRPAYLRQASALSDSGHQRPVTAMLEVSVLATLATLAVAAPVLEVGHPSSPTSVPAPASASAPASSPIPQQEPDNMCGSLAPISDKPFILRDQADCRSYITCLLVEEGAGVRWQGSRSTCPQGTVFSGERCRRVTCRSYYSFSWFTEFAGLL